MISEKLAKQRENCMERNVRLRRIHFSDWRYLARLSLQAFPDATPRQVSETLRDEMHIIVLEVDGRPAGYTAFRHERDEVLWWDWMVVDPACRSHGYGTIMGDAVEAIAFSRGYSQVMGAVLKTNHGTIRFHLAHGYELAENDERKYSIKKLITTAAATVPDIPTKRRPRIIRLWFRASYWFLVHLLPGSRQT